MMKIDTTTSEQSAATKQVDPARDQETAKAKRQVRPGNDQVQISTDAALLTEALRVLGSSPDVRNDLVGQMQKELAEGRIGHDVEGLADSIIDRLLEQ